MVFIVVNLILIYKPSSSYAAAAAGMRFSNPSLIASGRVIVELVVTIIKRARRLDYATVKESSKSNSSAH